MNIMSVEQIVALLKKQGDLRAPENDVGGILQDVADELDRRVRELEGEPE